MYVRQVYKYLISSVIYTRYLAILNKGETPSPPCYGTARQPYDYSHVSARRESDVFPSGFLCIPRFTVRREREPRGAASFRPRV